MYVALWFCYLPLWEFLQNLISNWLVIDTITKKCDNLMITTEN